MLSQNNESFEMTLFYKTDKIPEMFHVPVKGKVGSAYLDILSSSKQVISTKYY